MSKVLIVDDDVAMVNYLGIMLSRLGFKYDSASSGYDAIEYLKEHHPDIMLIDISLEEVMSGLDLVEILNKDDRTKEIYKVAVSAHVDDESSKTYIKAGFDACLKKPLSFQDLNDLVKNLV
ncbi:MAG: response regulator [Fidelibacterota bacterium]